MQLNALAQLTRHVRPAHNPSVRSSISFNFGEPHLQHPICVRKFHT